MTATLPVPGSGTRTAGGCDPGVLDGHRAREKPELDPSGSGRKLSRGDRPRETRDRQSVAVEEPGHRQVPPVEPGSRSTGVEIRTENTDLEGRIVDGGRIIQRKDLQQLVQFLIRWITGAARDVPIFGGTDAC